MSDVPTWTLFAYMTGDAEGAQDERRKLAPWQLHHVLDWCLDRGYDHVYLSRDPVETTSFRKQRGITSMRHHMQVVEGEASAHQGDEAA